MKRVVSVLSMIALVSSLYAQTDIGASKVTSSKAHRMLTEGYRGMADISVGYGFDNYLLSAAMVEFSTTHGYQISPYLFLGAGFGVQYCSDIDFEEWESRELRQYPIYGDMRASFLKKWITPFINLKMGYITGDNHGFYVNPMGGVRFGFTRKFGVHVGIGFTHQQVEHYDNITYVQGIVGIDF